MTDHCPNSCLCSRRKPSVMARLGEACQDFLAGGEDAELDRILDTEWLEIIACRLANGFEPELAKRLEVARRNSVPGMKVYPLDKDGNSDRTRRIFLPDQFELARKYGVEP